VLALARSLEPRIAAFDERLNKNSTNSSKLTLTDNPPPLLSTASVADQVA
jgi:hypothetical protein